MLKQLINLFIKKNGRSPNALEMLQLKFKAAQQSGKGQVIEFPRDKITDWKTPRPTTGPKGEVIDTSFKSGVDKYGKRVTMSNAEYGILKDEWFGKIIANTDDDLNTFLKKGIDAADDRFKNLTPNQRKDFLDMVEYRLKHGNKKFMNDFTDAAGKFKFPENLAGGGIAGMLGEPTYEDDNHRVPYQDGLKVYPQASVRIGEADIPNLPIEITPKTKDITYGATIMGEKDGLYGGIEGIKIKNKIDFVLDNQTLFKDTTDDEIMNFIIGKKGKFGDIRLKTDKDLENKYLTWNWKFNEGGRVPLAGGKLAGLELVLKQIMEKFGKKSITTADKIKRPFKAIKAEDTKAAFDRLNNKIATQEALRKAEVKMAGPIEHTKTGPRDFLESTDHTTWLLQEKFFDPKALDIYGKKVPSNWIAKEKKDAKKLIDDLGPLNVSPNHPNYKDMKAIRQSAKDRLESIKITEALGGNITMHDWLRMNRKNIKMSDYIKKKGDPVVKDELSGIKKAFVQQKLTPADELRKEFPGISDDLINKILTDDNPQRIAEVKATLHEAMKMQEKGMGVNEIINIFKKKPTKHASGGLAGMLGE